MGQLTDIFNDVFGDMKKDIKKRKAQRENKSISEIFREMRADEGERK